MSASRALEPDSSQPGERDLLDVRGLRVWAHVGVLAAEQRDGQWFEISFQLRRDWTAVGRSDDLADGCDYVVAIQALQAQAAEIRCQTLECYSEAILDRLEACYGRLPMALELCKCSPPIPGFQGTVVLKRYRRWT